MVEVPGFTYRFTAERQRALITAALKLCDGSRTAAAVERELVGQGLLGEAQAEALIADLVKLGVVLPGSRLGEEFHHLSRIPSLWAPAPTPAEVVAQVRTRLDWGGHDEQLELPTAEGGDLLALTTRRGTVRAFEPEGVGLADLGYILRCAYGSHNPVASAGGLHPLGLSLIVPRDIEELSAGLHVYDRDRHGLGAKRSWEPGRRDSLEYALGSETLLGESPVIVVISAQLSRQGDKYGARAYRYTLFEAGETAQNLCLAAVEMGLGTWIFGGFADALLKEFLDLPEDIYPLMVVAVGRPSVRAVSPSSVAFNLERELVTKSGPLNWVRVNRPYPDELCIVHSVAHYRPGTHQDARSSYRRRRGGGSGTTDSGAKIKALAEAYERWSSGQVRVDREAAPADLSEPWLDPRQHVPYSDLQYERYPRLQPFDETEAMQWVVGHDLADEPVLVPADLVFYPFDARHFERGNIYFANSNGVAAHQTYDQALDAAALELIERDCLVRTWLNRVSPPRVGPEAFTPRSARIADHLVEMGYRVIALDVSAHGAAVAIVLAVSEDEWPAAVTGASAHHSSLAMAVEKAVTEVLLGRLVPRRRGAGELQVTGTGTHGDYFADPERLPLLDFLFDGPEQTAVEEAEGPDLAALEITAVPLTSRDRSSRLQVVRALSPKLVPIYFGYGLEHYLHPGVAADYEFPGPPHPLA